MMKKSRIIFILFFLSGVSGLIYEVVWMKFLNQLLGLSAYAVSCVLTAFMAGLALGSFAFGRWIDKKKANPILVYAVLELGIGLWAVFIPLLVKTLIPAYIAAYRGLSGAPMLFNLARFSLAAAILIPPTTLMGATFPVLSKYITRDRSSVGLNVGTLYAINTFGATIGCLLAGFYLIGQFGLVGANTIAVAINLVVAIFALSLRGTVKMGTVPIFKKGDCPHFSSIHNKLLLLAFALSGFAALGYEVAWARTLIFFLDNSTWAFTTMLATFLFGIALGSHLFKKYADKTAEPIFAFAKIELAIGTFALLSIPIMWKLFAWEPLWQTFKNFNIPWGGRIALTASACSAVMLVPTILMGATFPVVAKIAGKKLDAIGEEIGSIYSINTLGAIFGAFLTGFFILPALGLQKTIFALALVNIGIGFILPLRLPLNQLHLRGQHLKLVHIAGLAITVLVVGYFVFTNTITFRGDTEQKGDATLFYKEGVAATVKAWQRQDNTKAVSVDGHEIGSNAPSLDEKQKLLAHLPLMLIDKPESVLVIGLGSGITLGAITSWDKLKKIDAVEIVPAVANAAHFFEKENRNALKDSRVKLHIEDGINFLLTSNDKYDLISSDAKLNPTFVGNASLYSEEYLRLCLEHLSDGGIMCEWIPLYLPLDMYKMILRTFVKVFPHSSIWVTSTGTTILMGYKTSAVIASPDLSGRSNLLSDLSPFDLDNPDYLSSAFQGDETSIRAAVGDGQINSLNHPYIEFKGPMQFMRTFTNQNEAENLQLLLVIARSEATKQSHEIASPRPADHASGGSRQRREGVANGGARNDNAAKQLLLEGLAAARGSGLYIRGQEYFKKAAFLSPNDKRVKYYFNLIDDEAETAERSANLFPNDAKARYRLGMIRLTQQKLNEAITEFQVSIALDAKNSGAHNNLGIAYHLSGRIKEAIAEYKKAFALDPSNEGIKNNLISAESASR